MLLCEELTGQEFQKEDIQVLNMAIRARLWLGKDFHKQEHMKKDGLHFRGIDSDSRDLSTVRCSATGLLSDLGHVTKG